MSTAPDSDSGSSATAAPWSRGRQKSYGKLERTIELVKNLLLDGGLLVHRGDEGRKGADDDREETKMPTIIIKTAVTACDDTSGSEEPPSMMRTVT
eukprot:7385022-Prymnesium_polylepis.1